jgi:hypothetical protein
MVPVVINVTVISTVTVVLMATKGNMATTLTSVKNVSLYEIIVVNISYRYRGLSWIIISSRRIILPP